MADSSLVKSLQIELLAAKEQPKAESLLTQLKESKMTLRILTDTMIGKSVKRVYKRFPALKPRCKELIHQWRLLIPAPPCTAAGSSLDSTRLSVLSLFKQVIAREDLVAELEGALFAGTNSNEYRMKARSIRFNLGKNKLLSERFISGKISPQELAKMTVEEMATEEDQQRRETVLKEQVEARRSDWNVVNDEPRNGLFQCGRCMSKWTMTEQKQILSADEPMTIFVKCMECSNSWQF